MEIEQSLQQTIQATVELIISNGIEYERFLRNIHKDSPEYEFLRPNSKHYHYFLQQLAGALRPSSSAHHSKQSGWSSVPEQTAARLEAMPVGLMCQIVKEAARKGMEPYSTLTQEDVSKLMSEVLTTNNQPTVQAKEQVRQLLKFVDSARAQQKKTKEIKQAKKAEEQQLAEHSKKDIKKPSQLPGRLLTSEMGISHDGSVSGAISGRYQGLGRSEDPYENFRRNPRR